MSSRRFFLRRVWHLAIPTPPSMGYSPTEYAEFTEPPTEMSSRRFLLRRVWHLAIPTPPAMGYSPTEYAEFTEPPTEMFSHGFHRFTQILRVRCSPQNSQNTQNLAAWVWQGCHTLLRHLEPSLLHVLPVLWVRLRNHLRFVDAQPGEHDCSRCERHRHAVVVVGVDRF